MSIYYVIKDFQILSISTPCNNSKVVVESNLSMHGSILILVLQVVILVLVLSKFYF